MIPSKIQSGSSTFQQPTQPDSDDLLKVKCLLMTFLEKATELGAMYANEAGRNTVTAQDVKYSMQYLAHEFMDSPDMVEQAEANLPLWYDKPTIDAVNHCTEDMKASMESVDESESESEAESDDGTSTSSTEDEFTEIVFSENPIVLKMNQYNREWSTWEPTDQVQISMKNAIDKLATE